MSPRSLMGTSSSISPRPPRVRSPRSANDPQGGREASSLHAQLETANRSASGALIQLTQARQEAQTAQRQLATLEATLASERHVAERERVECLQGRESLAAMRLDLQSGEARLGAAKRALRESELLFEEETSRLRHSLMLSRAGDQAQLAEAETTIGELRNRISGLEEMRGVFSPAAGQRSSSHAAASYIRQMQTPEARNSPAGGSRSGAGVASPAGWSPGVEVST